MPGNALPTAPVRAAPGEASVAALDSSVIPQPSESGTPSARKNSMIAGSIGAAPLVATRHSSSPILARIACLTCSGIARTASGDMSGSAVLSAAYSFSQTRGMPMSAVGWTCGAISKSRSASGQ
jgi:hypothetical protein